MILGQATIAAIETPNLSDARERGTDSTKKHETHPVVSQILKLSSISTCNRQSIRLGVVPVATGLNWRAKLIQYISEQLPDR